MILPQVAFALPTTILILRNFFRAIPQELEGATYIDGGNQVDFFWRVLLPLLVLNDANLWMVTIGEMQFQGEHTTDIALAMAPAIIFYLFAERHLVAGLTAEAVKG